MTIDSPATGLIADPIPSDVRSPVENVRPPSRLNREWRTFEAMLGIYCHDQHGTRAELCSDCAGLREYARTRLDRCRFGESKPTCVKCPVHCYQAKRRDQVRTMMRYAGPRMLWRHPILCLRHWLDGRRTLLVAQVDP